MSRDYTDYMELALDQRVNDRSVIRAWVVREMRDNPEGVADEITNLLLVAPAPPGDTSWDYRLADWRKVDALRTRLDDAVEADPETARLADALRQDAEERAIDAAEYAMGDR